MKKKMKRTTPKSRFHWLMKYASGLQQRLQHLQLVSKPSRRWVEGKIIPAQFTGAKWAPKEREIFFLKEKYLTVSPSSSSVSLRSAASQNSAGDPTPSLMNTSTPPTSFTFSLSLYLSRNSPSLLLRSNFIWSIWPIPTSLTTIYKWNCYFHSFHVLCVCIGLYMVRVIALQWLAPGSSKVAETQQASSKVAKMQQASSKVAMMYLVINKVAKMQQATNKVAKTWQAISKDVASQQQRCNKLLTKQQRCSKLVAQMQQATNKVAEMQQASNIDVASY